MKPALTFFLSHVQVDLFCENGATVKGLTAVWGNADRPVVPTTDRRTIRVEDDGIWCDDTLMTKFASPGEQLPATELVINRLLLEWHQDLTAFHAALISRQETAFMLIGHSGSGKSSLTLQAVRTGWTFHSDEMAVTDGELIWGVRRCIQFDATEEGEDLPLHMRGADRESYQWQDPEFGQLSQPLIGIPGHSPPLPLNTVSPVFLSFDGKDLLARIDGASALQRLYEGSFGLPKHDLGGLASRAFTLGWRDPAIAIQSLEQAMHIEPETIASTS